MLICKIEEQATSILMSKKRNISVLSKIQEKRQKEINNKEKHMLVFKKKKLNLNKPIVPSLIMSLAKSIEHTLKALTWALVSQKWKKNKGTFLRKTKIKKKKKKMKS